MRTPETSSVAGTSWGEGDHSEAWKTAGSGAMGSVAIWAWAEMAKLLANLGVSVSGVAFPRDDARRVRRRTRV